jgi:beta-galactosidase
VVAKIPAVYSTINWLGKGPHESYPDRADAALFGAYTDTLDSLLVPYIVPQENGNRTGVRRVTLSATKSAKAEGLTQHGKSITFIPDRPVNFSCTPYADDNVHAARHTCDLVDLRDGPGGYYFLHLDAAQRGVGTAACGPDTLEAYRVRPGVYTFRVNVLY